MSTTITLTAPDDWHIHLRDGDALRFTVKDAASQFRRAIVMPNLAPPILNAEQALAYKARIQACIPHGAQFEPLMVLYLTDRTSPADIREAKQAGVVACKLYPAGATTNSASGVTDIEALSSTLEAMAIEGLLLLVHGEVTQNDVDIFDREVEFLNQVLKPLMTRVPQLRIVLEHITTRDAVEFVEQGGENIAATITAHHLLFNRNHLLVGGVRPHYFCLPILKRRTHQHALIAAATSGNPKFFLGTDSAPHARSKKEAACGCAGCYTANSALALYAEAFEQAQSLHKLEAFASFFGPDYYGLPRNTVSVTLVKEPWVVPESLPFGDDLLIPMCAGETLSWRIKNSSC